MYNYIRQPPTYANYPFPDHPLPYKNVEHQMSYSQSPLCQVPRSRSFNPQLACIKPVEVFNSPGQIYNKHVSVNIPTKLIKTTKQFEYAASPTAKPVTTVYNLNNIKTKEAPKSILRNFSSFWTKSCTCNKQPSIYSVDKELPLPSHQVLDKNKSTEDEKGASTKRDKANSQANCQEKYEMTKNIVQENVPAVPLSTNRTTNHQPQQLVCEIKSPKTVSSDTYVPLAEKLSTKLEQAQEKILELEREKILLEQSLSAMKIEIEESLVCVQQSEAVMDAHYNYSTAVLSSIIDFCCTLSAPNKHLEVRQFVRAFALELFQLLIHNNAPNDHIAELIALNGILAETSHADTLPLIKQVNSNAAKEVFRSSKPLSSIRPL